MKTNTNNNVKKDTVSKTPWGPIAFVLTALLTIWVLMPASFAHDSYLTRKLAPTTTITVDRSETQYSDQWTAESEPITFNHMYRKSI